MLLKTALGIPKNRRNSPLLAALGIEKIEQLVKRQQLTLLRNALHGNSRARTFYMGMMRLYNQGKTDQYPASLLSRCKGICDSEQFSLHKYIYTIVFYILFIYIYIYIYVLVYGLFVCNKLLN